MCHVTMLPFMHVQRQYIFIHDTILEYISMGETEVTIQNLRNHYKKLQAHDPRTESSLLEMEYKVRGVACRGGPRHVGEGL